MTMFWKYGDAYIGKSITRCAKISRMQIIRQYAQYKKSKTQKAIIGFMHFPIDITERTSKNENYRLDYVYMRMSVIPLSNLHQSYSCEKQIMTVNHLFKIS